jgi:FG-GAP-like repeat/Secretion system C-terminal sorting domain
MKKTFLLLASAFAIFQNVHAQIDLTLFSKSVPFSTGSNASSSPHTICSGDIDGDGKIDVVVPNSGNNTVSIFRNICSSGNAFDTSSFSSKIDMVVLNAPLTTTLCDIDNDGKLDLAVGHYNSNSISIYPGSSTVGSIVFGNRIDIPAGKNPSYVIFADFDGDGKQDMVVSNFGANTMYVYRNTSIAGNISFAAFLSIPTKGGPGYMKAVDINRDGKKDIILSNYNDNSFSVFRNISTVGTIYFDLPKNSGCTGGPNGFDLCDLNNDTMPDIAIANSTSGQVSIYQNNSSGINVSFSLKVIQPTDVGAQELVFADLDRDGIKDLAVTNNGGNTLTVFHIKAGLTSIDSNFYDTKTTFNIPNGPLSLIAADMDGNSSNDLVVSNSVSGKITVLVNKYHLAGVGLNELSASNENKLMVYPNPFNTKLTIPILSNENVEEILFYDMCGKLLFTKTESVIDTKYLKSGSYFITVKTDKYVYHQKVIKQD